MNKKWGMILVALAVVGMSGLPQVAQSMEVLLKIYSKGRADVDGDGKSDMVVYDASRGLFHVHTASSTSSFSWGYDGTIGLLGDLDGDGMDDLVVYDPDLHLWHALSPQKGQLFVGRAWGFPDTTPVVGDVDGDGSYEYGVYHAESGKWFMQDLQGGIKELVWGFSGTLPKIEDFNADGVYDPAVYSPDSGAWYIAGVGPNRMVQLAPAEEGVPLVGDFDNDGQVDVCIYNPASGTWTWQSISDGASPSTVSWGFPETSGIAGDFTGDGADDMAVYDEASGQWWVWNLTGVGLYRKWGYEGAQALESGPVQIGDDIGEPGRGGGFIWKPVSEGDGKLVVLLPSSYRKQVADCYIADKNGKLIESGRFTGDTHNGARPHYRFSMRGSGYGNDIYVVAELRSGQRNHWYIPRGASRIVY